jgi:hypothetical protein
VIRSEIYRTVEAALEAAGLSEWAMSEKNVEVFPHGAYRT